MPIYISHLVRAKIISNSKLCLVKVFWCFTEGILLAARKKLLIKKLKVKWCIKDSILFVVTKISFETEVILTNLKVCSLG